ncbi:MAG TPA: glycosyltransferase [Rubrivivax sp.]|nr:glycosyltransferase [Rubrivivax sp.]
MTKNLHLLLLSHSAKAGGAESALMNLVERLLALGHRLTMLLPAREGEFATWCVQRGLDCLVMPMQVASPSASNALLQVALQNLEALAPQLAAREVDLVITNTAVVLHGARLAAVLGKPHIAYVHELLADDCEMRTEGLRVRDYLQLLGRQSDHLLCCSTAVQAQLREHGVTTPSSVLHPCAELALGAGVPAPAALAAAGTAPLQLFAIGVQSIRKNAVFAVTVLQALRLRGHDARLLLIGATSTQTPRLTAALDRRGLRPYVVVHDHLADPYATVPSGAINVVSARREAFGLTIVESLARGLPVVASRSGGPQELLDEADCFAIDDVDACVRRIEALAAAPALHAARARACYERLAPLLSAAHQQRVVADALAAAAAAYALKPGEALLGPRFREAVTLARLPQAQMLANIAAVARQPVAAIEQQVELDRRLPGSAVLADCKRFDVVPFTATAATDRLYREGTSFAIELAATGADVGRMGMAAFILARLLSQFRSQPLRTLALGDGIGLDTLRLVDAGLDVDYIDYDASLTAQVARMNFEVYGSQRAEHAGRVRVIRNPAEEAPYDAVVCLEVIEHVPDPMGFLQMLADRLAPGGLLFISECFDGVRDHWATHLQAVEDLSGLLPVMARDVGLVLDDLTIKPYGKPYVLRKPLADEKPAGLACQLRGDKGLLRQLMSAQLQVGA